MNTNLAAVLGAIAVHAIAFFWPGSYQLPSSVMLHGESGEIMVELVASPLVEETAMPQEETSAPAEPDLVAPVSEPLAPATDLAGEEFVEEAVTDEPPAPSVAKSAPIRPTPSVPPRSPEKESRSKTMPTGRTGSPVVVASPDYLRNPPPSYPAESRKSREQGTVLLKVAVTAKGHPAAVEVVRSSGHKRLDSAAVNAVRRWKFKPALSGGLQVAAEVEVPIRFQLK